ncbi:RNA polymerase I-specific transcription initiation factor RRN3 [Ceratina calcarata]|uniref:RNA polymerase I-specific transcription initiation factor RRN3 n=1 Tax=Ceratina calcarata TaxID=156304 RepID=A0AAJ7NB65_9HYME|nr:RNA polymerase I-specific transcription initiation factor RRN3 [Ceratina calcarata]XP_026672620.1 RNA polymerase I-specific transcription initiation factor RRN3 [Ceratina calcarata]
MSVVSSRVSSVSSILKNGVRSQLLRQSNRVYFKLPQDLRNIIYNFEAGSGAKDYEELICILRDSIIKDKDLIEFLSNVRQCISLLGPIHKVFIETLLQMKWMNRPSDVTSAYKAFLEDLICMQIHYAKNVIDNLVEQFKPDKDDDAKWQNGECSAEDIQRLNHIHDVLQKILKVVPMSSKLLLQSVRARYPYIIHGTHTHQVYVYALIQILDYAPQLRSDILSLIINRLMVLDVNIPRLEVDNEEDDIMDDSSECDSTTGNENNALDNEETSALTESDKMHPIANKLDVCMELILKYMHDFCFLNNVLQIECLKSLYTDTLKIFETVVLPTHASQYVQYIMFYICSFKTAVVEAFVDWLWRKTSNPNAPSVIRQSSVAYIANLSVTATFITTGLVEALQFKMCTWIHNYINAQDHSNYIQDENKEHTVFYAICQALFLMIAERHKDYPDSKKYMTYLQELDLAKIITCKLNPLKSCHPEIVHNFAEVTRIYQLAYCYTIIENNTRNQLPLFNTKKSIPTTVENFFPFSSYMLQRSGHRIIPLLRDNISSSEHRTTAIKYREDDEYMTEY